MTTEMEWILSQVETRENLLLDVSGLSGAKTYFLPREAANSEGRRQACGRMPLEAGKQSAAGGCLAGEEGYYVKIWGRGKLKKEADKLRLFEKAGIGPGVVGYECTERDVLVTRPLRGKRACDEALMKEPARLAWAMGETLRRFHEDNLMEDSITCPAEQGSGWILGKRRRAQQNYQNQTWDARMGEYIKTTDMETVYRKFLEQADCLREDTVIHGDYCLPNIFFDENYHVTGMLDFGEALRGDRHYDLFWGRWSLQYNLKTDRYGDLFYQAYGWDAIDRHRLDTVGLLSCLDG